MLKALFVIGQCIRLLHTDPWQEETLKIKNVGKYSYQVERTISHGMQDRDAYPIPFTDQKNYEAVSCPTDKDADLYK